MYLRLDTISKHLEGGRIIKYEQLILSQHIALSYILQSRPYGESHLKHLRHTMHPLAFPIKNSDAMLNRHRTRSANCIPKTFSHRICRYGAGLSSSPGSAHSLPTYLNQFGRQSSRFSHASPSVNRPVMQPRHFGEFGQLKNGMC